MVVYKDQWWCISYKECNNPCNRALTPQVQADADKWWESWEQDCPAPIDKQSKPECFKEKTKMITLNEAIDRFFPWARKDNNE